MARVKRWGPKQLRDHLGLLQWQFERARQCGDIPAPDLDGGKWSPAVVEVLAGKAAAIRVRAGEVPDCGSFAAAAELCHRLGVDVAPHVIAELCRQGLLRQVGTHKGYPLYDGRQLEVFDDRAAIAAAEVVGELLTVDRVWDRLGVRESDVAWLVKLGWLVPVEWARGQWGSSVPLYRAGDVAALTGEPAIDWNAVRATPRGRPSLLAKLTDKTGART